MAVEDKTLTKRDKRFCELYSEYGNGARAAREAGFSEKTAREIACHLLTKIHIQAYIKQLDDQRFEEQKRKFAEHTEVSIQALAEIVTEGRVEMARVMAANSLLDRAGHKAVETIKADINSKNDTTLNIKDESGVLNKLGSLLDKAITEAEDTGNTE